LWHIEVLPVDRRLSLWAVFFYIRMLCDVDSKKDREFIT
jgi:hypothetical protein